jgi:hypothetical protein
LGAWACSERGRIVSPRFAGAGVGGRLSAFRKGAVKRRGVFARDDACVDVQCGLLALKGLKRPRRVKAGRAANEHNRLFKFAGAELRRYLVDAALVQQQDGRDYILANALSGSPANVLRMQLETKATHHGAEDISEGALPHGLRAGEVVDPALRAGRLQNAHPAHPMGQDGSRRLFTKRRPGQATGESVR